MPDRPTRTEQPVADVPVLYCHPDAQDQASWWRDRFRLEFAATPPDLAGQPYLRAVADHLELRTGAGRGEGAWVHTEEVARRARQLPELLRACGLVGRRTNTAPYVLDAMAGWGVDGLVLAARGARVMLVERNLLLHALIEDLIRRAGVRSVQSCHDDGFAWLTASHGFDVVYLDPMFPERGKQALPGKRMQYAALLLGLTTHDPARAPERPLGTWIEAAVQAAGDRVVVKRRLKDPVDRVPDWQIRGRTVRYDVYRAASAAV